MYYNLLTLIMFRVKSVFEKTFWVYGLLGKIPSFEKKFIWEF